MSVSSTSENEEQRLKSEGLGAWTKCNGSARTEAQLSELCSLMGTLNLEKQASLKFFNVDNWDLTDQTNLLKAFQQSDMNSRKRERFQKTKYVLYSILWNYMAEFSKEMPSTKAVEVVSIALQWLISESVRNLDKIGTKLCKLTATAQRCEDKQVVKQLVMDLVKGYPIVLKWECGGSEKPLEICRTNYGVFLGLVNFTFGSMQLVLQAKETDRAFKVAQFILASSKPHFRPADLIILSKCIELAQVSFKRIFLGTEDVDIAMFLNEFRTKSLFGYKTPGLIMAILSSYFQFLSSVPAGETGTCTGMPKNEFILLNEEFFFLLTHYCESSEQALKRISVPEQCEIVFNFVIFLLQLIKDNVAGRVASDESLFPLVKKCSEFIEKVLPTIQNAGTRSEVTTRLCTTYAALAIEFRKIYGSGASLDICQYAIELYYRLEESMEVKVDSTYYTMLMADSFYKEKDFDSGLSIIARWVARSTVLMESQVCAYDIFDEKRYNDWGYQWMRFKVDSKDEAIQSHTMWDYLKDDQRYEKLLSKSLRLEINAYMTARGVFAEALINAGEHLEDHAESATDSALGMLAQVVGFWWGDDTNEGYCVRTCEEIYTKLNDAAREDTENPHILIIAAVTKAWLGITYLRTLQSRSQRDFMFAMKDIKEKTDEEKELEDVMINLNDKIVPALTSVTVNEEAEVASNIIFFVDALYNILQFEETEVKRWIDEISPGLVTTTARICALQMSCFGDTYNSIRAWHVVNVLARIYNRKYLELSSGMELYRAMPLTNRETLIQLEELNEDGKKLKHVNSSYFARLSLTKAIACLKTRMYQEGIEYLGEALELRAHQLNLDSYHLIMAECYLTLAQYKSLSEESELNFGVFIAETLCNISPAGLVGKALKLFSGISRKPNPGLSGWADMFHNYYLLSIIVSMGPTGLETLIGAGRVREAKYVASDLIFLCQQVGLVTRSFQFLIPIAETEIQSSSFDTAQVMIDAMDKLFSPHVECGINRAELSVKELMPLLTKLDVDITNPMRLVRPSPQTWYLTPVDLPECRYPVRGGRDEAFKEKYGFQERLYGVPKLLLHPLICHCYVCINPNIIPLALRFLFLQAKFAVAGSPPKKALTIISLARVHHQRAMFRILFHLERMCGRLAQVFHAKRMGRNALEDAYFPFFYHPSLEAIQALILTTPASHLEFLLECYKQTKEGISIAEDENPLTLHKPLEAIVSAIFQTKFITGEVPVCNSEINEIIQKAFESNKPELPLNWPVTPEREIVVPENPPQIVRGKIIINDT